MRGAARPRTALPPEARRPARRHRAPALDRRSALQPRVPRAPHGAVRSPGDDERCAGSSGGSTPSASTARSRCGSCCSSRASPDERFAIISKTHHSRRRRRQRDRHRAALFDVTPRQQPRPDGARRWVAAARALAGRAGGGRRSAATRARSRRCPPALATIAAAARACAASAKPLMTVLRPAPTSPLNVEIGPHRRVAFVPHAAGGLQGASRTSSAGPSTTWSWPSPPGRCASGCTRAG